MKSQVVDIVDIVSLKFASDEAAGWKVELLEPLFYHQYQIALIITKPWKKHVLNKQYALLSQLHLLTRVYGILIPVPCL